MNPWDNKGNDKDRISKLEAELEELKSQKENVQKVEVVDKEKKGIGCLIWFIIIIAGAYVLDGWLPDEKSNYKGLSINEKVSEAHIQYSKRDSGVGSSFLPRVGTMRGEDYRNCIDKEYFIDKVKGVELDSIDFCRWHAGLGNYSK